MSLFIALKHRKIPIARGNWLIDKMHGDGFILGYTLYKPKKDGMVGYLYIHLFRWIFVLCLGRKE